MDITFISFTIFVMLVGLKLCLIEKGTVEEVLAPDSARLGCPWCPSPFIRVPYGIFQLVGVVSTLGITIFTSFTEAWWFFIIYLVEVPLAILAASLLKLLLIPIIKVCNSSNIYFAIRVRRFIGTILILIGIILLLSNI